MPERERTNPCMLLASTRDPGAARCNAGAGLVEVMVAILVFALGLLGLAGMQLRAHQASYDAVQATRANALARDILARLGRNPTQAAAYQLEDLGGGAHEFAPVACDAGTCTAAELAVYDLARWQRALRGEDVRDSADAPVGGLVAGRVCIRGDGPVIRLLLTWRGLSSMPSTPEPADGSPCAQVPGLYGEDNAHRRQLQASAWLPPA